jgi:uncharacterized protein YceH (UPF0502 family)
VSVQPTGSERPTPAGRFALSAEQVRVLGCLLEKQHTTPDAYPLSLNALRLACNQSTNRDPVVEYDEATIRDALHRLERRGLVRLASGAGSRAAKYRHRLAEALPMDVSEQAIVCVLMLRGAQTPGELKQRGERMHSFADLTEVHDTLERLIGRGLAVRLTRHPGHKEQRYEQLLQESAEAGEREPAQTVPPAAPTVAFNGAIERAPQQREQPPGAQEDALRAMRELSERVARLERELDELRATAGSEGSVQAR